MPYDFIGGISGHSVMLVLPWIVAPLARKRVMLEVRLNGPVSQVPVGTKRVPPPAAAIACTDAWNAAVLLVMLSPIAPKRLMSSTGGCFGVGQEALARDTMSAHMQRVSIVFVCRAPTPESLLLSSSVVKAEYK